jgi:hypothetical protein
MYNFRLILGIILLPVAASAAEFGPVIRREAAKCAAAWQRADYAGILGYLPPRVIQQSGGRSGALRELKDQFARARELGVEQMEAVLGPPSTPRLAGRWLTSLIPLTAMLHGAHLDVTQQTHLLGLSADAGKHWYFVLLYQMTQAELNAAFPELAGKVVVPADPASSMEVVF